MSMTEIENSNSPKREGLIARAVRKAAEKLQLKYLEAEASKKSANITPSESADRKKPLEKVVTTVENGVKKHEWTTIPSKPIEKVKEHIASARGKGGALREIVSGALPQDEQLLQLLDEIAFMREAGATSDDALNFYQHNRGSVLGAEGEQETYSRMWLVAREIPITPDAIQRAATEGVGAAATAAHPSDVSIDDTGLITSEGKKAIKLVQELSGVTYDDPEIISKVIDHLEKEFLEGRIPQSDAANMKPKLDELRSWPQEERQL